MKRILLFTFSFFFVLQADAGHSTNNGGGLICSNGKCQTLIEAGLELSPEFKGVWFPSTALICGVHALTTGFLHKIERLL